MTKKTVKSVCPYCGVGCGIVMEVTDPSQPFITEFAFPRCGPTAFPVRERANGTMSSD